MMNLDDTLNIIKISIKENLEINNISANITDNTSIIGNDSPIDSMGLIQLCLTLEEKAEELNFEFDWTTETAMSKSKSMYRSVKTLSEEFLLQYNQQQ
jgi:acyl carrier protein